MSTSIKFVDDDNNGENVGHKDIRGEVGEKSTVDLPENYELANGQSNTVTFAADTPAEMTVHLKHKIEEKTVTRTIKIVQPDGTTTKKVQTVHLTRSATVDKANVIYGAWSTGQWDAYKVPTVDGYTPSHETVEAVTVDGHTYNTYVTITYTQTTHPIVETATKTLTEHFIYGGGDRQGKAAAPDSQIKLFFKRTHQVTADGAVVSYGQWELDPSQGTNGYQIISGKWQIPAPGNYDVLHAVAELPDGRKLSVDENREFHYSSSLAWLNPELSAVDYFDDPNFYDVRAEHTTYVYPVTKYLYVHDQDPKHIGNPLIGSVLLTGYADESRDFTWDDIVAASKHGNIDLTNYELVPGQSQTVNVDFEPQSPDLAPINVQHKHRQVQTIDHVKVQLVPALISLLHESGADMLLTLNSQIDRYGSLFKPTYHEVTVDVPVTLTYDAVTKWVLTAKVTPTTANIQESRYTDDELNGHDYGIIATDQGSAEFFDLGPDWRKVLAKPVNGYREQLAKLLGVPNDQTLDEAISKSTLKTAYFTYPKHDYATNTYQAVTNNQIVIDDGNLSFPDFSDFKGDEPLDHAPRLYNENKPLTDTIASYQILNLHFPKPVTRAINLHLPSGKVETVTQVVDVGKTASFNASHGDLVLELAHDTFEWANYEVPAQAGYTATQTEVAAQPVDEQTVDQTVDVYYTANDHQISINYVDGNGETVHTTTVTGKTGETVKVPNEVPTGWMITKGQVPSEISFGPNGHTDETIMISHRHVTVDPDHPQTNGTKLPDNPAKTFNGVEENDLNETVTRTIKVTTPDGKTTTTKQTVKLTRTATVDEVTSEVTYGDWSTGQWESYNVPTAPGYTASQSDVPVTKVTDSTKNQTVTVTYTANAQTTTINYVDGDGKVVHTTVVNGHTDQTVKVPNETPAGWTITDGQVPSEITFGPNGYDHATVTVDHKHVTVTSDKPQTDGTKLPDNPSKTFHGVGHDDLNKTIVRTIEVTAPTGKTNTIKQTAELTRTADVDEATGEVTYGKWTTGSWSSYNVPTVPGYTPSQAVVDEVAVNADVTNQTVKITYTANAQTTHINYVDENGEVVHATTVTGHTDQTVKVPNETPAGWTITDGQVPSEVTFGADGYTDVEITVDHKTVTVAPDDPQTDGTKLPDNPSLTFQGVEHDDLNRTVTRTIKVTTPDGKTQTVAQRVQLTRSADVDEATGEVTYSDWSTGSWEAYQVPTVPGYTASQSEVPATAVTADTGDQTVAVTYMANEQTTHIDYVDENGNVVHTTTVTGHTDQTVKVPNDVPTGWTVATGEVPSEVTFGTDGHDDVTVTVDHKTVTVTPDHPQTDGTKLPDNPALTFHGVGEDDLNRVVTRTFTLNVPGQDPQVVTQTAKLTRTATVDEVTGDVTYSDWTTGHWDAYEVPTVDGYTTDQKTVPAVDVTDTTTSQEIAIDYTAVPAEPETPAKPETPAEPETPAKPKAPATPSKHQTDATQAPAAKAKAKAKAPVQAPAVKAKAQAQRAQQAPQAQTLPQTGEKQNTLAPIGAALLGILGGFGLFGLFGKKRKKDEGDKL